MHLNKGHHKMINKFAWSDILQTKQNSRGNTTGNYTELLQYPAGNAAVDSIGML